MSSGARIAQIHSYFGEHKLTNADLSELFPKYSEEDIFRRSGINCRHVRNEGETPSDLSIRCAEELFAKHPELRGEIDMLLYCAEVLDYIAPATACIIHDRLGLEKTAGSIDIPMGCSGFTNGLAMAKGMIESRQAKKILLITAETPTSLIHPDDFYLRVLFSDAASCTIVEASPTQQIGNFTFGTDGGGAHCLIAPRSGARDPADRAWHEQYPELSGRMLSRLEMKGDQILQFALREVPPLVEGVLRRNETEMDEVDWFVFHHASGLIMKMLPRKLKLDGAKFYDVLESVGNTVSASIPVALQIGLEKGDIKRGQKVMLCGFGVGFSWSGTVVEI